MVVADCRRVVSRFSSHLEDWMNATTTLDDALTLPDVPERPLQLSFDDLTA